MNSPFSSNYNNNFINNRSNGRNRRRNFNGSSGSMGSIPSTDYQLPETFQTGSIDFPKAPSLGQFTPSNSGIKRDWSGSKMQLPEFKGLQNFGKSSLELGNAINSLKPPPPQKVIIVGAESEEDNPAPRRRRDGSEIPSFGDFGLGGDDSPSSTTKSKTSYDEDGELVMNPEGKWSMGDTGRTAKELFKWGREANRDRKARKGMKDRGAPDTPAFDDGGVFD